MRRREPAKKSSSNVVPIVFGAVAIAGVAFYLGRSPPAPAATAPSGPSASSAARAQPEAGSEETCDVCSGFQLVLCQVCGGRGYDRISTDSPCPGGCNNGLVACRQCAGLAVKKTPTLGGLRRFLESMNKAAGMENYPPNTYTYASLTNDQEVLDLWKRGELRDVARVARKRLEEAARRAGEEAKREDEDRARRGLQPAPFDEDR